MKKLKGFLGEMLEKKVTETFVVKPSTLGEEKLYLNYT
jgi:hypothetical protein